jgi:thiamine-monophosphate kinase
LSQPDRRHLLRAHLEPRAQVELGRLLAREHLATAMIDVSDGVLQDLSHICEESRVGADLVADDLPISEAARRLAELEKQDPIDWALSGGEDYVLLFCIPADKAARAGEATLAGLGLEICQVGVITSEPRIRIRRGGSWSEETTVGYDHFA